MGDKGVRATDELRKTIEDWPPEKHDSILRMVEGRTFEFRSALRTGTIVEFIKTFYELFDKVLEESTRPHLLSCGKGCHACCRQNVTIWEGEAEFIANYCKTNGIEISKEYLKEQLKYGWREVARTDAGWCVFLKNGLCSIYEARPLACRKYLVSSNPEKCDTVKYLPPNNGVWIASFTLPEVEASAFYGVMSDKGKCGRLPKMMMPYSK